MSVAKHRGQKKSISLFLEMECLSSFVGGDNTWRIMTAYTLFLLTNKDDHLTGDSCFVDPGAFGTEMATMSTCFVSTAMTDLKLSFLNSLAQCLSHRWVGMHPCNQLMQLDFLVGLDWVAQHIGVLHFYLNVTFAVTREASPNVANLPTPINVLLSTGEHQFHQLLQLLVGELGNNSFCCLGGFSLPFVAHRSRRTCESLCIDAREVVRQEHLLRRPLLFHRSCKMGLGFYRKKSSTSDLDNTQDSWNRE